MVVQADSTLAAIRKKVRRLTASSSEAALSTDDIDQYINTFYNHDFPYAIKLDVTRSVYTFYTRPYIDRYPLDVNFNMGIRAPVYVDGIRGNLFKDRLQFYNVWPRFPTRFQQAGTTLTGLITGIAQPTNPTQITSVGHNLLTGAIITIDNVLGMTQLNGNSYQISVIDANTFSLDGVDNTAFGAYLGGGSWISTSQSFSFVIPGPFISKEVTIGGVDQFGGAITINDDGDGNLQISTPNPVVTVPPYTGTPAIPGMHNQNTQNPGLNTFTVIGTVDYVTGRFDFLLPPGVSLASGTLLVIRVSQYSTGRPYNVLFWNNELTIRPIPKFIHKVEVETYLTPVQFMATSDNPILNQWWQYIAIGAAIKVLQDRQDMEGLDNLSILFDQQEALVLERQGIEEIDQRNATIYSSSIPSPGWNFPYQGWF